MEKYFEHMKNWAMQSHNGITKDQLMRSVVAMADDGIAEWKAAKQRVHDDAFDSFDSLENLRIKPISTVIVKGVFKRA